MTIEQDETINDDIKDSTETKLESNLAERPEEDSESGEETEDEREARLDAEEKIVRRNCVIFGVLPLFIGFWVFCYFFFQYLEEHKVSSIPATSSHCEHRISHHVS